MAKQSGVFVKVFGTLYDNVAEGVSAFSRKFITSWAKGVEPVGDELKKHLVAVSIEVARRNGKPWPGGTTDKSISKRTGAGINAMTRSVQVSGATWNAMKGSLALEGYMLIQEFGGKIGGKGKLLTIPLPAALDGRGIPLHDNPRAWENTFVGKSRNGNLIIFQRRLSQIVPLYVLRSTVYIPARLGLRETMLEKLPNCLDRAADRLMQEVMRDMR